MMSRKPKTMGTVRCSLKTRMPITIAVIGSKAPRTATIVLFVCLRAIISVTLLIAVGNKPSITRLKKACGEEMGWM